MENSEVMTNFVVMKSYKSFFNKISIMLLGHKIPKKGDVMTKEELQTHLDSLCKQNGFDYAKYLGSYNGDEVYQPKFNEDGDVYYGYPCLLHVRGNKVRRSRSHHEAFKVLRFFYGSNLA